MKRFGNVEVTKLFFMRISLKKLYFYNFINYFFYLLHVSNFSIFYNFIFHSLISAQIHSRCNDILPNSFYFINILIKKNCK